MLIARTIAISLLLTSLTGGIAVSQSSKPPPQTPQIQSEQNSEGAAKGQHQGNNQANPTKQTAPAEEKNTADNSKRESNKDAERRTEEGSEYGVFIGRRLKITDFLLALFTLFLVMVGIGQGIFLYRTDQGTHKAADAAKKSADVAQNTLIATQRPWISVKIELVSPLRFSEKDVKATFRFTLKNVGVSPANNVYVDPLLVPTFGEPGEALQKLQADYRGRKLTDVQIGGLSLFPGDFETENIDVTLTREVDRNAREAKNVPPNTLKDSLSPTLVGAVIYRSPIAPKISPDRLFGYVASHRSE